MRIAIISSLVVAVAICQHQSLRRHTHEARSGVSRVSSAGGIWPRGTCVATQSAQPTCSLSRISDSFTTSLSSGGGTNLTQAPNVRSVGICYDLIADNGECRTDDAIRADFEMFQSTGYRAVRVYDVGCYTSDVAGAAAATGMQLMLGLNGITQLDTGLNKLATMAKDWSSVVSVYIGNEVVSNNLVTPLELTKSVTAAKSRLRDMGYSRLVITVERFDTILADPSICLTADACAVNIHAFFNAEISAADAGTFVNNMYSQVVQKLVPQTVLIAESGWPREGSCNGAACPSTANQQLAIESIRHAFSGPDSSLYLFQAHDAKYKSPGPYGVERSFGLFHDQST